MANNNTKSKPKSRRPKPMVTKAGFKPIAMGGGRYGCGGKLK